MRRDVCLLIRYTRFAYIAYRHKLANIHLHTHTHTHTYIHTHTFIFKYYLYTNIEITIFINIFVIYIYSQLSVSRTTDKLDVSISRAHLVGLVGFVSSSMLSLSDKSNNVDWISRTFL